MARRKLNDTEKRKAICINLHPTTVNLLKMLSQEEDMSQGKLIEKLIQEHAERNQQLNLFA